jgi:hypothetical protein
MQSYMIFPDRLLDIWCASFPDFVLKQSFNVLQVFYGILEPVPEI